jgi:hypothetical protein
MGYYLTAAPAAKMRTADDCVDVAGDASCHRPAVLEYRKAGTFSPWQPIEYSLAGRCLDPTTD